MSAKPSKSERGVSSKPDTHFLAWYRKYRPQNFDEVTGQDHVISILKQSIAANKVAHAYLFSGTRGTGKTSVARIFAKEIGVNPSDMYEIDAASNTSIEDIRSLNESVHALPIESPFKVYILDEVHMLSKSAFNALLKTLEEPPKHVIFILATTEIHKLPETVISRCESYVFKTPTPEILRKVLASVASKEKVNIDEDALDLVAILGDGSFRDTLSMFQKVATIGHGNTTKITGEHIAKLTGAPRSELISHLLSAWSAKDASKLFEIISQVEESDIDIKVLVKMLTDRARFLLMKKVSPAYAITFGKRFGEKEAAMLETLSYDEKGAAALLKALVTLLIEGQSFTIPAVSLELALITSIS